MSFVVLSEATTFYISYYKECLMPFRIPRLLFIVTAVIFSLIFCLSAYAGVLYVIPGGTGNGTSWAQAFGDLQEAIEIAAVNDNYTQVWVAAGTYKPTGHPNGGSGDRGMHFSLRNGVSVYGGFIGTESQLNERDFKSNKSILSGDIGIEGFFGDNTYNVFYHPVGTNLDSTAILDGFTISYGYADGFSANSRGGGMYNHSSHPILRNLTISDNQANWYGGGVYFESSLPILRNITISDNQVGYYGGGIYFKSSLPNLIKVTISGNSAKYGGGIYNESSHAELINVTISSNQADSHGGAIYNKNSDPRLINVTISDNQASSSGGGIYNYSSSPTLENVTISGNKALNWYGGGIYNDSSNPTLTNVTIFDNYADWRGGGIYNTASNPIISNCIFWGNTDDYLGQIYNYGASSPEVTWSLIQNGYPDGSNIFTSNPQLSPLADNGGLTKTHAIPMNSPAYAIPKSAGGGNWNGAPENDQRGMPRSTIGYRAMGAFEGDINPGSLNVVIQPQNAVKDGGKWRRTGTETWLDSGYTESPLPVDNHTIEFKKIDEWLTPENQIVLINEGETTYATGTYKKYGSLQIYINPQEAADAGAQWRIAGTQTWYYSGETVHNIPTGKYTIEFRTVPGWRPIGSINVVVIEDVVSEYTGTYEKFDVALPGVMMLLLDDDE
jgi:parallel beta-helix repeat protein/predicted outer membrane repeat protein